jgi:predicted AAA+ superfamily ATPase
MMVKSEKELKIVRQMLKLYPAVGIIGARRVGKTTLAGMIARKSKMPVTHFDLENPEDLARLTDPMLALRELKGLVHSLLNINSMKDLESHPKSGATWEGFVLDQIIRIIGARYEECFFWATHAGAELDMLIVRGKDRFGFEVKRTTAPAITPSMRIALSDLKLNSIVVVHAGDTTFPLSEKITAMAFTHILDDLKPLI